MSKYILGYILFLGLHFIRNRLPIKCLKGIYLFILFIIFFPLPNINIVMIPVKDKNIINNIHLISEILVILGIINFCFKYYNAVKFKRFVKEIGNRYKNTNIYFCEEVNIPCTIGIIHPIIVMPFRRYKQGVFKYILRHEETHIVQGDNLLKVLLSLYICLIWFLPFRNKILEDFTDECEIKCDDLVCKRFNSNNKKEYAKLIIKYSMNSNCNITDSINCMSSYSRLEKRIVSILKDCNINKFIYLLIVVFIFSLFVLFNINFYIQ